MAAPALVPILKKVAAYVVTDKKLLKTVLGIVLGIIIIVLTPIFAFFKLLSGDVHIDTAYLQSYVEENFSSEEIAMLQGVEEGMKLIETKMTEAGYDETKVKRAQVLYTLALYDYSEQEGFTDNLVGCFEGTTNDEQLINAVNLKFGTNISYAEFQQLMDSIETDTSSDESSG